MSDVIEAFYKAIKVNKNCQILNLGTGKPIEINEIVNLMGCKVLIYQRDLENLISHMQI